MQNKPEEHETTMPSKLPAEALPSGSPLDDSATPNKCPPKTNSNGPRRQNSSTGTPSAVTPATGPNSTVVLKNLPFELDPAELDKVLDSAHATLRYKSKHLSLDDLGRFRGIAFLNFYTVAEAAEAHDLFVNREFIGRPVRVEYRYTKNARDVQVPIPDKLEKAEPVAQQAAASPVETPVSSPPLQTETGTTDKRREFFLSKAWQKEPTAPTGSTANLSSSEPPLPRQVKNLLKERYEKLLADFIADRPKPIDRQGESTIEDPASEYIFPASLSSQERAVVHRVAELSNLGHRSFETDNGIRQLHVTRDPVKAREWTRLNMADFKAQKKAGSANGDDPRQNAQGRAKTPASETDMTGIKFYNPRAQRNKAAAAAAAGAAVSTGNDKADSEETEVAAPAPGLEISKTALLNALGENGAYAPARPIPKGPDGTRGFARRIALRPEYQSAKKEAEDAIENAEIGSVAKKLSISEILASRIDGSVPEWDPSTGSLVQPTQETNLPGV